MSALEELPHPLVDRIGDARLPTAHGEFRAVSYRSTDGHEHIALIAGDPASRSGQHVLTRLHSECLTGDALASQRCDCGAQLSQALQAIAAAGRGVVVYLRGHEGRGIGLANKIRAYQLQDEGLDTVDANLHQGLPVDSRSYEVAAEILRDLGVRSVRLMTNNPSKSVGLASHGIDVVEMVPAITEPTEYSAGYLATKRERMGHTFAED